MLEIMCTVYGLSVVYSKCDPVSWFLNLKKKKIYTVLQIIASYFLTDPSTINK